MENESKSMGEASWNVRSVSFVIFVENIVSGQISNKKFEGGFFVTKEMNQLCGDRR